MSEQTNGMNGSNGNKVNMDTTDLDREVIRCKTCGLVQYRTRMGNCRRCLRLLPPKVEFLISAPEAAGAFSRRLTGNSSKSGRTARRWIT